MKKIKLSVIIPVYNVEKYLESCLDSVAGQTFSELEVLIVNDGSTDLSPEIINRYVENYEHFNVIHQKNRGLSAARNTGIKASKGQYIAFLDSDDFIDPNMYQKLYEIAVENGSDIIKCGTIEFDDHSKQILKFLKDFETFKEIESQHILLDRYLNRSINCVVWNGIYHRKLFKDLQFPEGVYYEDHYVTPKLLLKAEKYTFTPEFFCYYRRRGGAITLTFNTDHLTDKLQSLNDLYQIIVKLETQNSLKSQYSSYFYKRVIEYHNALIYKDPGTLIKNENSIQNLIDQDVFEYVLNKSELKQTEKMDLKVMKKSHYLFFVFQKMERVLSLIDYSGNKSTQNKSNPYSDELQKNYTKVIRELS